MPSSPWNIFVYIYKAMLNNKNDGDFRQILAYGNQMSIYFPKTIHWIFQM